MTRQNQAQHWFQLGASLVVAGFAAIGCSGEKASDSAGMTGTAGTNACALQPNAPTCRPPAVDNPSVITPPQTPAGSAGSASVGTTPPPPPTMPSTPPPPPPNIGTGPMAGAPPGAPPGPLPGAAGAAAPPITPGVAGAPATPGTAGAPAAGGPNVAGIPDAELNTLRQACVDEINMYRATLPMANLKPMKRATPMQEGCSDMGAQMDGDSGEAHGAARAGLCRSVGLFAENTCPGWPVGGFGGATLTDVMKKCLAGMWAEGEPPVSHAECQMDYQGCFLKYGHYLNMSDPGNLVASCAFYKMKDGKYWLNQDFAAR